MAQGSSGGDRDPSGAARSGPSSKSEKGGKVGATPVDGYSRAAAQRDGSGPSFWLILLLVGLLVVVGVAAGKLSGRARGA